MEDTLKFYELWQEYNSYMLVKFKEQSYRKIYSNFKNHILPYFKDFYLKDINQRIYLNWMLEIEKKGYKNSYNKNLYASLVMIFNYAIKFGYLEKNIPSLVGGFKRKKQELKNVNFWTLNEYEQFISVVDSKIYRLLFDTLYFTGLRIGECLALTWNDLKYNYIDVNKTISKEKNKDNNYTINSPKTMQSFRKVQIDDYLISNFNNLYNQKKNLQGFSESWFIFGDTKPLSFTTVTRKKDTYCLKARVKKIRLHDFRHSHATLLLSKGVPITVISQRLGHADTNLTLNTYSHLILQDVDEAVKLINNIKLHDNLI